MGWAWPSGTGAGVVCNLASLAASDTPESGSEEEEEEEELRAPRSRKSVARKCRLDECMAPWA